MNKLPDNLRMIEQSNDSEAKRLLRDNLISALVIIQKNFGLLDKDDMVEAVYKILTIATFSKWGYSFRLKDQYNPADSDYNFDLRYMAKANKVKYIAVLTHEVMHNVFDAVAINKKIVLHDKEMSAVGEFLGDIASIMVLSELGYTFKEIQEVLGFLRCEELAKKYAYSSSVKGHHDTAMAQLGFITEILKNNKYQLNAKKLIESMLVVVLEKKAGRFSDIIEMALQKYRSDVLQAGNSKKYLFSPGGNVPSAGLKDHISVLSLDRVKEILGARDHARTADGLPLSKDEASRVARIITLLDSKSLTAALSADELINKLQITGRSRADILRFILKYIVRANLLTGPPVLLTDLKTTRLILGSAYRPDGRKYIYIGDYLLDEPVELGRTVMHEIGAYMNLPNWLNIRLESLADLAIFVTRKPVFTFNMILLTATLLVLMNFGISAIKQTSFKEDVAKMRQAEMASLATMQKAEAEAELKIKEYQQKVSSQTEPSANDLEMLDSYTKLAKHGAQIISSMKSEIIKSDREAAPIIAKEDSLLGRLSSLLTIIFAAVFKIGVILSLPGTIIWCVFFDFSKAIQRRARMAGSNQGKKGKVSDPARTADGLPLSKEEALQLEKEIVARHSLDRAVTLTADELIKSLNIQGTIREKALRFTLKYIVRANLLTGPPITLDNNRVILGSALKINSKRFVYLSNAVIIEPASLARTLIHEIGACVGLPHGVNRWLENLYRLLAREDTTVYRQGGLTVLGAWRDGLMVLGVTAVLGYIANLIFGNRSIVTGISALGVYLALNCFIIGKVIYDPMAFVEYHKIMDAGAKEGEDNIILMRSWERARKTPIACKDGYCCEKAFNCASISPLMKKFIMAYVKHANDAVAVLAISPLLGILIALKVKDSIKSFIRGILRIKETKEEIKKNGSAYPATMPGASSYSKRAPSASEYRNIIKLLGGKRALKGNKIYIVIICKNFHKRPLFDKMYK